MPRLNWTRRGFLAATAASTLAGQTPVARNTKLPSEKKEYRDRTTEFTFYRVNAPSVSAWLPSTTGRMFARRAKFLLHASDRAGSVQAWTMELKSGELRLQSTAAQLDPASLSFTPDERAFCYVDQGNQSPALYLQQLNRDKPTKLADLPGHMAGAGVTISFDSQTAVLVSGTRLLRVNLTRGGATVLNTGDGFHAPTFHPRRAEIAYFAGSAIWTLPFTTGKAAAVPLPPGRILDAHWSTGPTGPETDTNALLYLHQPDDSGRTVVLREYDFTLKRDRRLALTSQFASFTPNADCSVFAGASFSKAQPHVLMLVRSVARELTLCEHNATDAAMVTPVFTPDSREVFFQSNREGKPAIYSMTVDKLVEATEDDESER
jgi:oligogalacturonide lyase